MATWHKEEGTWDIHNRGLQAETWGMDKDKDRDRGKEVDMGRGRGRGRGRGNHKGKVHL